MKTFTLKSTLQDIAAGSYNFLDFLDRVHGEGLQVMVKMKGHFGFSQMVFSNESAEISITKAHLSRFPHLDYHPSRYDPVLRWVEMRGRLRKSNDLILNEAGEVRVSCMTSTPAHHPTRGMEYLISNIVRNGGDVRDQDLLALCAGYDRLFSVEETLLRLEIEDRILPEINDLPDPHRHAALKWTCRLQDIDFLGCRIPNCQELALQRQRAMIARKEKPMKTALQAPENDELFPFSQPVCTM